MAGKRVHQLAKELKMTSKELIAELNKLGMEISNPLASVDEKTEAKLKKKVEAKKAKTKVSKEVKPAAKKEQPETKATSPVKKAARKSPSVATGEKVAKEVKREVEGEKPEKKAKSAPTGKAGSVSLKSRETAKTKEKTTEVKGKAGDEASPAQVVIPDAKERGPAKEGEIVGEEKREGALAEHPGAKGERDVEKKVEEGVPSETEVAVKPRMLKVPEGISVRDFAQRVGKSPEDIVRMLVSLGEMVTVNQSMSDEAIHIIGEELGYQVEVKSRSVGEVEAILEAEPEELLERRPPVVTVMGHVDHGKTSLLDAIRMTDVTSQEVGGITQHIGAYQVSYHDRLITFIDTPGHESFTALRARGAQITDIAVLVVAADDGVMPQTIEAIDHANAAGVPILVAINKIDKEGANPLKVRQDLTEYQLVPEEWGGDVIYVDVSAKQKTNLDKLLENILLLADLYELKANFQVKASGVIIEARLDRGRGPVATLLVQRGTLRVGDALVAGSTYGRVRAMFNDRGEKVMEATPSTPVEILGLSSVPNPGDEFRVVEDEKRAKAIAHDRRMKEKISLEQRTSRHLTLEELLERIKEGDAAELKLILKCDVQGSVEALVDSVAKLGQGDVKINILHKGVGAITESDIMLASASDAIVIGFNVRPDPKARELAERENVDVRLYRVIYQVIEDLQSAMEGLLEPEYEEVQTGYAEVLTTFRVPRVGVIAGCMVKEGEINRGSMARLIREGAVVYEGRISSLKRFKDDVRSVSAGFECGIGLENFQDIKDGDIIETYELKEKSKS